MENKIKHLYIRLLVREGEDVCIENDYKDDKDNYTKILRNGSIQD